MKKDPIIEEIRKVREQHAAKFNYNLDDIVMDLNKREKKAKRKVVALPAKPFLKATGT